MTPLAINIGPMGRTMAKTGKPRFGGHRDGTEAKSLRINLARLWTNEKLWTKKMRNKATNSPQLTRPYVLASAPTANGCTSLNQPTRKRPINDTGSNCRG